MATSGMLRLIKAAWLLLLLMIGLPNEAAAAALPCGTVTATLAPCFEYVLKGGKVPSNCCSGVKSLYRAAGGTSGRRAVCTCLKSVTSSASPAAVKNAQAIPSKCGVWLPYKITPTIDCNKVT